MKEQYKPAEKLELRELKKEYKKINCPSCGGEVNADNLNLQNSIAKCGNCNAVFSIAEEIESLKMKAETKQEIFRPEGIDLFHYRNGLDITIQQHVQGLDIWGIILFPIFAFFSTIIYFAKDIPIYAPILFTLGTLFFTYRVLNYSKNKTYIDITDQFLNIKSRPKHFRKDKAYAVSEISQLYLKMATDGSGYFTIHMIVNGLEGQKHEKLLTVNTLSKAKYLEQEIERYLNIEDRKVPEANV
ncbi:MAG: hypothetical protein AAGG75_12280 [Bacteroidota bacterium]